jgi:16S rRNA (guanine(527)-N(7))-methyltransferase RsmG
VDEHERGESLLMQKLEALEARHHVVLLEDQRRGLEALDRLVEKWNRAISLVGFRTDEERIERYFIEALHASRWLPREGHVLDIGSGGGTPALPLAIQNPGIHCTLLEPSRRKAVFLEEAIGSVTSGNATVLRCRFEEFEPQTDIAAITTRGVNVGPELFGAAKAWLRPGARLLLFTGADKAAGIERAVEGVWRIRAKALLALRYKAELLVAERT